MHASSARRGVMAHSYAFSEFTVNGKALNETGINALVAGEVGVGVSLVSGDDELLHEVREILGDRVVYVTVKVALGGAAAITHSPAAVQRMLEEGAREAVRRARAGEIRPFTLEKPYQVAFTLRRSYADSLVQQVDRVAAEWGLEKTGPRSYRWTVDSARRLAWFIDRVEGVVLP
jgi:D-amino peptidase